MSIKKQLILLIFALVSFSGAKGQNVGLKTNFVGDGLLSPNLGIELALAPKWTMEVSGQVNFWDVNNHKWKHWVLQPEFRYWFCERFAAHFLGFHFLGGEFNFGHIKNSVSFLGSDFSPLADRRYQGWGIGAGVAYGYSWVLGMHWNLEAEIGLGWIYTRYDVFPCAECGKKLETDKSHNYFGPTKAALNLVYLF